MGVKSFEAEVNKTVTVEGIIYTLTPGAIPSEVTLYLNDVALTEGTPVRITDNMTLRAEVDIPEDPQITVTTSNLAIAKFDNNNVTNGDIITVHSGAHTMQFEGATSIPEVTVNGDGVTGVTVNSQAIPLNQLPYTFQPIGGVTNQVFMQGADTGQKHIQIVGEDIETVTINNQPVTLPYSGTVTEDLIIGCAGEIYQLDISSPGGTKVNIDGVEVSDGTSPLHRVFDVDHDSYVTLDAKHKIIVDGDYIHSVAINGVEYPADRLPLTAESISMITNMMLHGYRPSEVHLSGAYINTCTLDGDAVPVDDNETINLEFETLEENHFINIQGAQPRPITITFDNNGATKVEANGQEMPNLGTLTTSEDTFVSATPLPIPVHFESTAVATVQINGKVYRSNDFTFDVTQETEVDITTETCLLTVAYGDNTFTFTLPQAVVTLAAPHRDGWIFDTWSSDDLGIVNAKSVQTTLDLNGKARGHLVAHYQRCLTWDKPNVWN